YSPSSRTYLDPMYIDVAAVPDYGECPEAVAMTGEHEFRSRLQALRDAPLVDHPAVCEIKLKILRELFASFCARHSLADDARRRARQRRSMGRPGADRATDQRRRTAGPVQPQRTELGACRVESARARRAGIPAVGFAARGEHGRRRRTAHRSRDVFDAPLLDS